MAYSTQLNGMFFQISDHMMRAIHRYTVERKRPGSFLRAVICNDLKDAVGQADHINIVNIPAFVSYFYNDAPSACWGSEKKMKAWLKGEK